MVVAAVEVKERQVRPHSDTGVLAQSGSHASPARQGLRARGDYASVKCPSQTGHELDKRRLNLVTCALQTRAMSCQLPPLPPDAGASAGADASADGLPEALLPAPLWSFRTRSAMAGPQLCSSTSAARRRAAGSTPRRPAQPRTPSASQQHTHPLAATCTATLRYVRGSFRTGGISRQVT